MPRRSERFFPGRTLRHALRTLGRSSPDAFLASTLGRVTLGSTEGVHPAVAAMTKAYELNVRPSRVSTLESGARWTVVRLDKIVYFLDSHHVGTFWTGDASLARCVEVPVVVITAATP